MPNLFLVEPPIYATLVVAAAATGPAGAGGLGAAGLGPGDDPGGLGAVRPGPPRRGSRVALLAVAAFAVFPLTIRYGRAFQPDALMLGTLVAGLRCWDEHEAGGGTPWLVHGGRP